MKWIRGPAFDLFWIWGGVWVGAIFFALGSLPFVFHVPLPRGDSFRVSTGVVVVWLLTTGILLESAHLASSVIIAWANREFRLVMIKRAGFYIALPVLLFLGCLAIGAITAAGWTRYVDHAHGHYSPGAMYLITDWHNPFPVLVWVFVFSVAWHFSMQHFGLVRLYRARFGSIGWRRTDLLVAFALTFTVVAAMPVITRWPWLLWPLGLHLGHNAPGFRVPWWFNLAVIGGISWGHWLAALGLGTAAVRRWWLLLVAVLLFGLVGFAVKFVNPQGWIVMISGGPLFLGGFIGLHAVHYVYDIGTFKQRSPVVRRIMRT